MRRIIYIAAFVFANQNVAAAESPFEPLSSSFPGLGPNGTAVIAIPKQSAAAIVGPITADTAATAQRILNNDDEVRTLYIDSGGGDVVSSIQLGNFLRQRNIRLVVAGRCFSACANYVFTGARTKVVLPGSLIGIHGQLYHYLGEKMLTVDARDKNTLIARSNDPSSGAKIAAIVNIEREFYRKLGISGVYHSAYNDYDQTRNDRIRSGKLANECPKIDLWVLGPTDLKNMGVTGMGTVWAPKTNAEAGASAARFGFDPKNVFFGTPSQLAALCEPNHRQR